MSALSYYNEPAPLAWDVAAAIFGTDGVGGLYVPSSLDTLFQDANGTTPAVPGSPVGLVLDKSGNVINLSQPTTAARPILARMPKTGRRNLVSNSEDLSIWAKSTAATINVDTDAGPVFNASGHRMDRVTTLDTSPVRRVQESNISVTPSVPHRVSAFVSKDTSNAPAIAVFESPVTSNELGRVNVDFSGAIPTAVASAGATDATIHEVRPGVYRVAATIPANPATSAAVLLYPNRNSGGGSTFFGGAQLTQGAQDHPYQHVRSAYDVTEEGVPDTYSLVYDLADDNLTTTLPQAVNGDLLIAGTKGSIIEPVSYAAGSTFTLGPDTYTGNQSRQMLQVLGDIVGVCLIDRTLTQTERDVLIQHYRSKGAKGLLVPGGPNLIGELDFNNWTINDNVVINSPTSVSTVGAAAGPIKTIFEVGKMYRILIDVSVSTYLTPLANHTANTNHITTGNIYTGKHEFIFRAANTNLYVRMLAGGTADFSLFDIRELRPQEDWT